MNTYSDRTPRRWRNFGGHACVLERREQKPEAVQKRARPALCLFRHSTPSSSSFSSIIPPSSAAQPPRHGQAKKHPLPSPPPQEQVVALLHRLRSRQVDQSHRPDARPLHGPFAAVTPSAGSRSFLSLYRSQARTEHSTARSFVATVLWKHRRAYRRRIRRAPPMPDTPILDRSTA